LASGSKTRAEILDKAKIPYEVVEHNVDEDEAKISYAHLTPEDIATKLAEL
jgi:predicted house-cleaning NTP pyrophosphatase (Maf/HAM1 superfamily)